MKYFIILSAGAYSDYEKTYYMGDREITEEELYKKGEQVGDLLLKEYNEYPARIIKNSWGDDVKELYNPENNETVNIPYYTDWIKLMEEWLKKEGYTKLPTDVPEINCYYDFPTSNNKARDRY